MTYYLKRLEMYLQGYRNQPSRKEVNELYSRYRNKVMSSREIIKKYLAKSDFEGLVGIAEYGGSLGMWTAIEAAFCLGYEAGKEAVVEKVEKHFAASGSAD